MLVRKHCLRFRHCTFFLFGPFCLFTLILIILRYNEIACTQFICQNFMGSAAIHRGHRLDWLNALGIKLLALEFFNLVLIDLYVGQIHLCIISHISSKDFTCLNQAFNHWRFRSRGITDKSGIIFHQICHRDIKSLIAHHPNWWVFKFVEFCHLG